MDNVNKLPDSYAKHRESNNFKLLNINEQAISLLKKDMEDVFLTLDIQQVTGKTLDLYGDMVGQKRGSLKDLQYRFLVFTKMGINVTQCDHNSILETVCRIFNCEPSDIVLDDGSEDCQVVLTKFPVDILLKSGFSNEQAVELIEMLLPAGVTINGSSFDGTFEFAETYGEYDEKAGFGNIEQTIGGYFGVTSKEGTTDTILPI